MQTLGNSFFCPNDNTMLEYRNSDIDDIGRIEFVESHCGQCGVTYTIFPKRRKDAKDVYMV